MKFLKLMFIIGGFLIMISPIHSKNTDDKNIRHANVAGAFYPADKNELSKMIDDCLNVAVPKIDNIFALIVPHAGYIYSASVAGYSYKSIQNKNYKTIIIIGPSHHKYFEGFALDDKSAWETPLGQVKLDTSVIKKLAGSDKSLKYIPEAYNEEHCIEVQVPFLQKTLKNFSIVPILTGALNLDSSKHLAEILYEIISKQDDVLLVISSDLSHYYPYETACGLDENLINDVSKNNIDSFYANVVNEKYEACGAVGIGILLQVAQKYKTSEIKLLKYANSGDTAGEKSKVVGYSAFVITKNSSEKKIAIKSKEENQEMLNDSEKKEALKIARETIEYYFENHGAKKEFSPKEKIFNQKLGAFVTLHKNGNLRGCIGNIIGYEPLWETIRDMAIESAFGDPRFSPLKKDEFDDVEIEISVLSPLKKAASSDEIILGKHGVIVKKGYNQGVFLPQVADETGWSKEQFLGHLCQDKAGLSYDAWKDSNTELYIFTAQVFSEK
jgi:MEMO1 family protein